ncbi:DUF305 domain-containing protein [Streptomyces roseochromogenus]|uniref:DUF305 domain-containing protein n=1 Tax=Streptomyces roseochromogenus subsp. oscitans DS 12.976 TaxID=1352936 RepID=V6JV03_STRRC|nr:DUF305 domain-containing protein [Streptomyces roseochromogenus]EST20704.1 hypothetical protein M878_38765 [Streptomyces roseochromogenus subsp. oscitans DS 12.976]
MTTRTLTRRATLAAVAATAGLVLAACGGSGGRGDGGGHAAHGASASPGATGATASTAHNAQDVAFAQAMIPHHQQALEMARLAADRASSAQVKDLVSRIEKAQDPEIRTMTGWLKSWGEQVPMAGMDHSGHSGMSGMMSDADMAALKKAEGKDFDTKFLSMMVEHHQGAVEMAGTEKAKGAYGPAKALAGAIVTAQNAEIKEMKTLLGSSGTSGSSGMNGMNGMG